MEFFSDKNEQMKHLRKGFIELLDNTLCYDFDWKADYFEQAKEEIEEAKNIHELIDLFEEFYNYVRSVGDDDDWMEQFQEFGHDELEVRFCEKCGCMMVQGFYFPTFSIGWDGVEEYMCEDCFDKLPQQTKDDWEDFYTPDGEDCWTQWEC